MAKSTVRLRSKESDAIRALGSKVRAIKRRAEIGSEYRWGRGWKGNRNIKYVIARTELTLSFQDRVFSRLVQARVVSGILTTSVDNSLRA